MLDMRENEIVGMVLPMIETKYGEEKADALVEACREADSIGKLPAEIRAMVKWGMSAVDMESGKPKGGKVKKAMTYHQARGGRFFNRGGATPGKIAKSYDFFRKYNPYHDARGRFSSKNGFASYSVNRKIGGTWGEGGSIEEHIDPQTGMISKERAAEYNRIINKFLSGVEPPADGEPTLDYMGGGGGSGKSYTIKAGVVSVPGKGEAVQINADDIKLEFKEFRERAASDDPAISMGAAAYIHEESSIVTKMLTHAAMAKGVNIVIDGVASNPDKIARQVTEARDNGYHTVRAHYIATPTEVALQSSRDRYYNNPNKEERRYVPDAVLVNAHKAVSRNFPQLVGIYDEVEVVTNDRQSAPRQIAYKKRGGSLVVTDQAAFDSFIAKKD